MNARNEPFDLAVSRWLDGEASPEEARAVEARVAADPALAEAVAKWRAAGDALRDDVPAAPRGLAARVYLSALSACSESDRFHAVAKRYAAAAAAILALGVGGSLWLDRTAKPVAASEPAGTLADLLVERRVELSYGLLDPAAAMNSGGR
jgi:anti-sigma factor RsiW